MRHYECNKMKYFPLKMSFTFTVCNSRIAIAVNVMDCFITH